MATAKEDEGGQGKKPLAFASMFGFRSMATLAADLHASMHRFARLKAFQSVAPIKDVCVAKKVHNFFSLAQNIWREK